LEQLDFGQKAFCAENIAKILEEVLEHQRFVKKLWKRSKKQLKLCQNVEEAAL